MAPIASLPCWRLSAGALTLPMFIVMFILMFTHRLIPAPIRELEESIMPGAVAAKLDSIKEKTGIRGRQVADLVGTTPQTVSRWQQGRVDPARIAKQSRAAVGNQTAQARMLFGEGHCPPI